MTASDGWYGKFRGLVIDNRDPMGMGRVRVSVPDVLGSDTSAWASPCVPLGGPQLGPWLVPPVGAAVWVEFEQGSPDHPICVGGRWGSPGEAPPLPDPSAIVIRTGRQHSIVISDTPGSGGGIALRTPHGAVVEVNDTAITISNGEGASIIMKGPTISFNEGAMTIP